MPPYLFYKKSGLHIGIMISAKKYERAVWDTARANFYANRWIFVKNHGIINWEKGYDRL